MLIPVATLYVILTIFNKIGYMLSVILTIIYTIDN